MAKLEGRTIEDGSVMGYVRTDNIGSKCTFAICPTEEWELLTDEEAEELAKCALNESGVMEWGY